MLNQVDSVKEIGKDPFFFVRVAMKSPWAAKIWDILSKKGPFFWFVFFGPTKKMNMTIGLKGVSLNKGLLEYPTNTMFLS